MPDNKSNNSRIAKNTLFLYIRMFFVMLVSLYTARVVLNVLGASDYGIYNVVGGFVSLFAFLNATLASSMSRFYNYEGGRLGEEGYAKVFSVGIRVHAFLALTVLLLLETFGLWYINNVMVLPEDRLKAANYLFQFSVFSMLFVILTVPFRSAIVSKERMGFYAVVDIIDVVLKLIIVIVLPYVSSDKLIFYALLQFVITILNFILNLVYAKTQFNCLHISPHIERSDLKEMLSFSGWNLLGTFAFMLKEQGVNLLLNAFFGTIVNAARGIAFAINAAITGFSSNISMAFKPQMVSSYAKGDFSRSLRLFTSQSKICFCLMLMLVTPLILEMDLVLHLWLGEAVPDYTRIFASIVLAQTTIGTLNPPVTQMVFATGKISRFQIYSSSVNILLLPVCWLFLYFGYDAWIVFIITFVFTILNQCVCLAAMRRVVEYSLKDYLKEVVFPCVTMAVIVPILPILLTRIMEDSFLRLLIVSVASLLVTALSLYCFFLNTSEKIIVNQYMQSIINKKKSNTNL